MFVHKQRMAIYHVVKNLLGKPVLIGPLESDIVKVRDMSEKATENKVYCRCEASRGKPHAQKMCEGHSARGSQHMFKGVANAQCLPTD